MALFIDRAQWPGRGRKWAHLISDLSFAELHDFARTAGLPERAFHGDHYDVPAERWSEVVAAGASPTTSREIVRRLNESGLRRPKGRPGH